mgnify:FL=1|jgi:hypothetical protein|tara:strand:- start:80 stop:265 length:186 start_codon:yes stop_codon:yes gene_type:complete
MKYSTIKSVLRSQLKNNAKVLWTWKKDKEENFTCIYKNYNDNLPIYTPQQLLEKINEETNL